MNAFGSVPLPTDNLYKFYALTGVAVVIFTLYGFIQLSYGLIQRLNAQTLAVKKAEIEVDYLNRFLNRIEQIENSAKANLKDEDALKQGKIPLHASEEDLKKMILQKDELYRDVLLKEAEIHSGNREIAQAQMYLELVCIVGTVFAAAFAWLARYGFKKWRSIQEIQDRLLERQSAEVQSESSAKG